MNNRHVEPAEIEIDLIDLMWRFLAQWKAIILVSLIMAVLLPCIKLASDSRKYDEKLKDAERVISLAGDHDTAITDLYSDLPEEDRKPVRQTVKQDEAIDHMLSYINESPVMSLDPDGVRTLTMDYRITTAEEEQGGTDLDESDHAALYEGYAGTFENDKALDKLSEALGEHVSGRYAGELINCDGAHSDETIKSGVFHVSVMLPDGSDADAAEEAVRDVMDDRTGALSSGIKAHRLKLISASVSTEANREVLSRQAAANRELNDMRNIRSGYAEKLSDKQKLVYDQICAVKTAREEMGAAGIAGEVSVEAVERIASRLAGDEIVKPKFSFRYVILGFILGAALYCMAYTARMIQKRSVSAASVLPSITGTRLIGEMHRGYDTPGGGRTSVLSFLTSSRSIARLRYGSAYDQKKHASEIAGTLDAMCLHKGFSVATLLLVGISRTNNDEVSGQTDMIRSACMTVKHGLLIDMIETDTMEESDFLSVEAAIIAAGSCTKIDRLTYIVQCCKDYDVTVLGSIYLD